MPIASPRPCTIGSWIAAACLCASPAADLHAFGPIPCPGLHPSHVQGIATDKRDAIFWSWTDALAKTDARGKLLLQIDVARHHGDLCHHDGKLYVAVNLGKFNEPPGAADSWVYVYDADTLAELTRHAVPELVHGAGGIERCTDGFIVVGGLPTDVDENYLYEYDEHFNFRKRHTLASGHTTKGIQTVARAGDTWWFGCYGNPKTLLRADARFQCTGRWHYNAAYGIAPLADGRFLICRDAPTPDHKRKARLIVATEADLKQTPDAP